MTQVSDVVRVRYGVSMRLVGCRREDVAEIPRAEWDALDDAGREKRLDGLADSMIEDEIEAYAYVDEGDDHAFEKIFAAQIGCWPPAGEDDGSESLAAMAKDVDQRYSPRSGDDDAES
jgi:hypothetical protein